MSVKYTKYSLFEKNVLIKFVFEKKTLSNLQLTKFVWKKVDPEKLTDLKSIFLNITFLNGY